MDEQQIKCLSIEEMRQRMAESKMVSADYHLLRRECRRRLEVWDKLAKCAGCAILLLILLALGTQWWLR
jgi:hypothetical protein